MAIILGKKPIIETKEYEDYAVGLSLPIQISNVAFKQNYTEIEQLKTNIKNLLLTKRGERLMNPLFGSGVETVLFEPITDEFEDKIQDIITNSVFTVLYNRKYEPEDYKRNYDKFLNYKNKTYGDVE